ncbi:uncharacterized protein A4U43_C01F14740 [Asparagus officinalis]|uniref:HVA22-like protein n=1 Tax=Asparagus officinalis TaxID=4686 RepID=A0A5P1FPD5_ASPOF|nr:uncharacterized protein A4U43_C01F14740 [Asparagus officinalis]
MVKYGIGLGGRGECQKGAALENGGDYQEGYIRTILLDDLCRQNQELQSTNINYAIFDYRPAIMLLYPLYASVQAIETEDKLDDEQWLAYWILYSFLTLMDMVLEPILRWVPIWYEMKVLLVAWLVLPQFRGAAFIYDKFVRKQLRKYGVLSESSSSSSSSSPPSKSKSKSKNKYLGLVTSKKVSSADYFFQVNKWK